MTPREELKYAMRKMKCECKMCDGQMNRISDYVIELDKSIKVLKHLKLINPEISGNLINLINERNREMQKHEGYVWRLELSYNAYLEYLKKYQKT